MNNELLLRRKGRVVLPVAPHTGAPAPLAVLATLAHELEHLGHRLGPKLQAHLTGLNADSLQQVAQVVLPLVRKRMGAHVNWQPLYPGFPQQVMQASVAELYWHAFLHYLSEGRLRELPYDPNDPRPALARHERFAFMRQVELGEPADFERIFRQLAGAGSSLSTEDQQDLRVLAQQLGLRALDLLPRQFTSRENLAVLTAALLRMSWAPSLAAMRPQLRSATDALRLAVAWCGGDVSLAAATRFEQLPRRLRRMMMDVIEASAARDEDMQRRPERFKRLGQVVHAGEFARSHPQAAQAFARIHAGERVATFNREVESRLAQADLAAALQRLRQRPGELARRLDVLLRRAEADAVHAHAHAPATAGALSAQAVLQAFDAVSESVSTAVLLQLIAHFRDRAQRQSQAPAQRAVRAFFPKGELAKVYALADARVDLPAAACWAVVAQCEAALLRRFAQLPPLGRCWVDPQLMACVTPMAQRSASKALRRLTRGSRLPMPQAHTLRLFLWWKNGGKGRVDIDLSAALYNANYQYMDVLSYYSLKSWGAVHSGDLVDGGEGAAEFIDLDVGLLRERGVRWVVVAINSYTEQAFCDLPECFAGWMARQAPGSGEVFEPATVADRIDLAADSTIALPMVLDLETLQLVWADIALTSHPSWNNVHNNLRGVGLMLRALTQRAWPDLHTLFALHAKARGELVGSAQAADVVFALDGQPGPQHITPFDLDRIRADFL